MEINRANLDFIFLGFDTRYRQAYAQAPAWWNQVATEVPSGTSEMRYGWLARVPKMREWVGERILNNLKAHDFTIRNRDWELSFKLERNHIMDDQLGLYNMDVDNLGWSVKKHPDDLIVELLENGQNEPCFDDQNFFDTDHPIDKFKPNSPVQSNLFNLPLTPENYQVVRSAMMSFKGEDGRSLGVVPNLLVVPSGLEGMAKLILQADTIPAAGGQAAQTNVQKGTADLLVIPELLDPNDWYLLCTRRPVKPFVYQTRQAPNFVWLNASTDHNVFFQKQYVYGVDSRDNAGYGPWFLAAKSMP